MREMIEQKMMKTGNYKQREENFLPSIDKYVPPYI